MSLFDVFIAIFIGFALVTGICEFIVFLARKIDQHLHPDRCPICREEVEHLDVCFECPFVVVDKWDGPDYYTQAPCSGHCGLKDKDYLEKLKNMRTDRLI